MFSALWDAPANKTPFVTDPTPYELHLQRQREAVELRKQVRKFGDEAMRVDPRLALDAPLPPEDFERAFQLRMPDQMATEEEDPDPLRSLMKALGIKKRTSKKSAADSDDESEKSDDRGDANSGPEGFFVSGEPSEE